MAVRTPLYFDGDNNLRPYSASDDAAIKKRMVQLWTNAITASISVVSNGTGNMTLMSDTAYQAGDAPSNNTRFSNNSPTSTSEYTATNFNKLLFSEISAPAPADTNNKAFPIYLDASNNLHAMTLDDMVDTYARSAIQDILASGNDYGGLYKITNSEISPAGHTIQSATTNRIFRDTVFDTSLTLEAGTTDPDARTLVNPYYLHQANAFWYEGVDDSDTDIVNLPIKIRTDNDLQTYSAADFDTLLQSVIRYTSRNITGCKVKYEITVNDDVTGLQRGVIMTDTQLTEQVRVNTLVSESDNYISQNFPSGTPSVKNSYRLRLILE